MRKGVISAVAAMVAAVALAGTVSADPADEFGVIGGTLELKEISMANPEPAQAGQTENTQPVETLPDGTPKYLSQDGGDGEHASVAVSHAMRTLVGSGEFSSWGIQFGETEQSTDTATIFWVQAGETRFLLTLERE